MHIEAIHNHIVFEFLDKVTNKGEFERSDSHGGITLLQSADDSAGQPRWAKILSLGPTCDPLLQTPGCEILITNLMWTAGVPFDGRKVWRTEDTHVLAVRIPDGSPHTTFGE